MADFLPHVGAALVTACITLTLLRRFSDRRATMVLCFALSFVILLIPISNYAASHYIRVLTGDLSIFGFFWLGAADLAFLFPQRAWRCRKPRRNEGPRLCATCIPTRSCRGVLTPWPAAFRSSVMSACLYFAGITLALIWPGRTPSSRWPVAVHRTSLRLLCHNAENLNARSARHLNKTSNVSCESLDGLECRT